MCRVCVFDLGFDSIEELKSLFLSSRKSDFWSKLLSKIIFDHRIYIFVYIFHHFPIRLFESMARLVPLEPNRARKDRPGKSSADSSSDLSPRANRNEYDHFSIFSKIVNLRKTRDFHFPFGHEISSSKNIFRFLIISVSICLAEPHP